MGGTGLEPVTPSLSSRQPAIRQLAFFSRYYTICRSFAPSRRAAFASVFILSRGLVVARGSTIHRSWTLQQSPCLSRARVTRRGE
jgi:hypothetical protein